jgi:hypothetical protein
LVSEEEMTGDEEQFDCETCPVAQAITTLDADNREAWRLFGTLHCRFAVDVPGVAAPVLARVMEEKTADEATDLLSRLSIIYEVLHPPSPSSS